MDEKEKPRNRRLRTVRPEVFRARELRSNQPDVERIVWSKLRGRRFAGYKFSRQVPIGNYVADFVCRERMLIVELDGGQHNTDVARDYDGNRTGFLESKGYRVLRFWNHNILEDWDPVSEVLVRALQELPESNPQIPPGGGDEE